MGGWIKGIVNDMINEVLDQVTSATMSALNWVLTLLTDSVFHSPDLTSLPLVMHMSGQAQIAANACMTLIIVIVGLISMTHGTLQDRYSLKELLPRMVLGFVLANMANPILRGVIATANAVTDALVGDGFTSQDSFDAIRRTVADVTGDSAQFIIASALQLIAVWMLVFVVVTWLGRLSVLLVAAATAPAALLCHATPFTEPVAKMWWRALLSALAVQVLQAVTLHLAVAAMLDPGAALPALGLPDDPTGLFNMLVACFLLWMVIRVPAWVTRNVGGVSHRGHSIVGSAFRLIVVQRALRAVGLRGGGRNLPGRRAGAAGPRQPANHFHQHANAHQHVHEHVHLHAPGAGHGPGAPPGASGAGGSPQRPAYWAGDVTPPTRARAGRPPLALERRPSGSTRRALGSGRG